MSTKIQLEEEIKTVSITCNIRRNLTSFLIEIAHERLGPKWIYASAFFYEISIYVTSEMERDI